jgi:hypothetical protein
MVDNSDLMLPTNDLSSHIEVPEKRDVEQVQPPLARIASGQVNGMVRRFYPRVKPSCPSPAICDSCHRLSDFPLTHS